MEELLIFMSALVVLNYFIGLNKIIDGFLNFVERFVKIFKN